MTTSRWIVSGFLALLIACADRADTAVDPAWGKQACAHCAMLVSEAAYAAQATTPDGRRLYFDDIGCMVLALQEASEPPLHTWVHHEHDDTWLDANTARYRHGARTPMDSGLTAVREGAGTLDWTEAVRRVVAAREQGGNHDHH